MQASQLLALKETSDSRFPGNVYLTEEANQTECFKLFDYDFMKTRFK